MTGAMVSVMYPSVIWKNLSKRDVPAVRRHSHFGRGSAPLAGIKRRIGLPGQTESVATTSGTFRAVCPGRPRRTKWDYSSSSRVWKVIATYSAKMSSLPRQTKED